MADAVCSPVDVFNKGRYEIPAERRPVNPEYFFRDQFDIASESFPGGDLYLTFSSSSEEDYSRFSMRFTLVESSVICPCEKEFVWTNLDQGFSLPPGRYRMEIISKDPQL